MRHHTKNIISYLFKYLFVILWGSVSVTVFYYYIIGNNSRCNSDSCFELTLTQLYYVVLTFLNISIGISKLVLLFIILLVLYFSLELINLDHLEFYLNILMGIVISFMGYIGWFIRFPKWLNRPSNELNDLL